MQLCTKGSTFTGECLCSPTPLVPRSLPSSLCLSSPIPRASPLPLSTDGRLPVYTFYILRRLVSSLSRYVRSCPRVLSSEALARQPISLRYCCEFIPSHASLACTTNMRNSTYSGSSTIWNHPIAHTRKRRCTSEIKLCQKRKMKWYLFGASFKMNIAKAFNLVNRSTRSGYLALCDLRSK